MKPNDDIRRKAKLASIRLWQIAEELDLTDTEFSRKLRHEVTKEEKERILRFIELLRKEKNDG